MPLPLDAQRLDLTKLIRDRNFNLFGPVDPETGPGLCDGYC